ncbi:septum formation initiator family protein [Streptomyces buecherae]|uniref:Septum formation initiator family protein n=2 Tax=Streptomyces buecherae TaxID=2763006 RepID=A0A7H8NIE3_9ACTN|nr:septum formation initiator family protein [Streptomyces buecherae]QKW54324.1 septum formation initiator family protein [Streptomyces buecherae]
MNRLVRLRPTGRGSARRAPFVLLVVVLLGSGLITLLVLNSSLNQGSFELSRLERQTDDLTDEQQALQQEVDELAQPNTLERRARELGLVPGGGPAFLNPDGTVRGVPAPATKEPTTQSGPTAALPPALQPSSPPATPAPAPTDPTLGPGTTPTPGRPEAAPAPVTPAPSSIPGTPTPTPPGPTVGPGATVPATGHAAPGAAPVGQPPAPGAAPPANSTPTFGR